MFTTARLVDTGVQNVLYLSSIARIRGYYRELDREAARYFARWDADGGETADALGSLAVKSGPMAGLFTAASTTATGTSRAEPAPHKSPGPGAVDHGSDR
ncbi:hypothetical protein [Nonomuraea aurantiaca]|uniref:hypothetical protein n=1 Tax=Nonomuraea aurantiaca TaxID=2878562 RepID=UPI001CD99E6F|nr:hypothetical protein [Nonomuraea aurantiaca]MCA2223829.1 hypothetical protein [Nonomuraea aurantiaca]